MPLDPALLGDPPRLEAVSEVWGLRLSLIGPCRLARAGKALDALSRAADQAPTGTKKAVIDLSRARPIDGGALACVVAARAALAARGVPSEVLGLEEHDQRLFELLQARASRTAAAAEPAERGAFDQIGQAAVTLACQVRLLLSFVGDLVVACARSARRPSSLHGAEVTRVMERAGVDGLPIVLLLAFLVGLVMGFQGAVQLEQFGASIFVADLVGLAIARELGPLMAAIIVAGRSGAAFAAELGTMRVSEEIDALETLGLDPQRFLVLPRVIALVLVLPILTLLADGVGIFGGLVVGVVGLDLTPGAYIEQTRKALELWDVGSGLLKSIFFAGAIATIACERGLATSGGAEGVGRSTTQAVVASIFALVVIDAAFTVAFHLAGL